VAGKTYTMLGTDEDPGLIPRICKEILASIDRYADTYYQLPKIYASFYEIYNEKVYDLLSTKNDIACRVREHQSNGAYVENLTLREILSYDSIFEILDEGQSRRSTAATLMNASSSRSHAIYTIYLEQYVIDNGQSSIRKSKFNLVDLAGSERVSMTGVSGQQLVEANNINKSLSTLGDVIQALSLTGARSAKKDVHIPYRNSILTWLLKESLSGNSKTTMLAAVSPVETAYQETLSTLKYMERVKAISTMVSVNKFDSLIDTAEVQDLRKQIADLTEKLKLSEEDRQRLQLKNEELSQSLSSFQSENVPPNTSNTTNDNHKQPWKKPGRPDKADLSKILASINKKAENFRTHPVGNILSIKSVDGISDLTGVNCSSLSGVASEDMMLSRRTRQQTFISSTKGSDHTAMRLEVKSMEENLSQKEKALSIVIAKLSRVGDAHSRLDLSMQRMMLQLSSLISADDSFLMKGDEYRRIISSLEQMLSCSSNILQESNLSSKATDHPGVELSRDDVSLS
jgi:regulator of replication initiation timing